MSHTPNPHGITFDTLVNALPEQFGDFDLVEYGEHTEAFYVRGKEWEIRTGHGSLSIQRREDARANKFSTLHGKVSRMFSALKEAGMSNAQLNHWGTYLEVRTWVA